MNKKEKDNKKVLEQKCIKIEREFCSIHSTLCGLENEAKKQNRIAEGYVLGDLCNRLNKLNKKCEDLFKELMK